MWPSKQNSSLHFGPPSHSCNHPTPPAAAVPLVVARGGDKLTTIVHHRRGAQGEHQRAAKKPSRRSAAGLTRATTKTPSTLPGSRREGGALSGLFGVYRLSFQARVRSKPMLRKVFFECYLGSFLVLVVCEYRLILCDFGCYWVCVVWLFTVIVCLVVCWR